MFPHDTIAAISSAIGPAARIIVRLSGPQSLTIASKICPDALPQIPAAKQVMLDFAALHCPAWIYLFHNPASYTGEDLVEFHLPGNPQLAKMFLASLTGYGARQAEPGEFTARAYLSGKMDLTTAEGVAATIAAANQEQLDAARQLLAGELANRLTPVMNSLADTLGLVEVGIDFSEEEVTFLLTGELRQRVESADRDLAQLLDESDRFEELVHQPQIVLVGRPNAGKSTLINALAGRPRSVVSTVAGTTRDVLTAEVQLPHGSVQLIDVAGLEESADGQIQQQAQRHARRAMESAQYLALVQDVTDDQPAPPLPRMADLTIFTKIDLRNRSVGGSEILVSAHSGAGLPKLREALDSLVFGSIHIGARLALNSRHVKAVSDARSSLSQVLSLGSNAPAEVVAMELREAIDALGQVLGNISPDDVLGRIFSRFCIGK